MLPHMMYEVAFQKSTIAFYVNRSLLFLRPTPIYCMPSHWLEDFNGTQKGVYTTELKNELFSRKFYHHQNSIDQI